MWASPEGVGAIAGAVGAVAAMVAIILQVRYHRADRAEADRRDEPSYVRFLAEGRFTRSEPRQRRYGDLVRDVLKPSLWGLAISLFVGLVLFFGFLRYQVAYATVGDCLPNINLGIHESSMTKTVDCGSTDATYRIAEVVLDQRKPQPVRQVDACATVDESVWVPDPLRWRGMKVLCVERIKPA